MSSKEGRIMPHPATALRRRTAAKSSLLKRLKKLVGSSRPTAPQVPPHSSLSTFSDADKRRIEALKSVGLLEQSIRYGDPYRDEEDDARTILSPKRLEADAGKEKDLLINLNQVENYGQEKEHPPNAIDEKLMSVRSPTRPLNRMSVSMDSGSSTSDTASTFDSDLRTLAPRRQPIPLRRIGSLTEEIEQIEDEESRRLTEVAFLS